VRCLNSLLHTGDQPNAGCHGNASRLMEAPHCSLFDASPLAILVLDKNLTITRSNAAANLMLGYASDTLCGLALGDLVADQNVLQDYVTLFEGGVVGGAEHCLKRSDGAVVTVLSQISLLLDAGSKAEAVLVTMTDITARKKSEERLRFQAQVLDSMSEAVVVTDLDGIILYWGIGSEKLYGYKAHEVIGRFYRDVAGSIEQQDEKAFQRMLLANNGWHGENIQRRRDGTTFWSDVHIYILRDERGEPCGFIGLDYDITDKKNSEEKQKTLERQLQQAQKIESIGRLAGGVSHDFNNMLGVIMANTEMLIERMPPDPDVAESLHHIHEAAKRSALLTRHLLAFARKQVAKPCSLSLNQEVDDTIKMLRRMLGENVKLCWHPSTDEENIWFDRDQISQVLVNLCVNAKDAMGEQGGILRIRTDLEEISEKSTRVEASLAKPGYYMVLSVEDTGCGMSAEVQERLFEPFFTTKEVGTATGLGLSTIFGIVSQNGGFIEVKSAPGKGSTFLVYIPVYEKVTPCRSDSRSMEEGAQLKLSSKKDASQDNYCILLVEDEAAVLHSLQLLLVQMGHRVIPANRTEEAIALARKHSSEIDLLLTDVVMPDMNGHELSIKVREICPSIRCVFMSGYAADVMGQHGILTGDTVFLAKPFTQREMHQKLSEAMSQECADMHRQFLH